MLLIPCRYYVKKGRLDLAIEALSRVRGQRQESERLQDELAEIQANYEYELQVGEVTWFGCFTGGIRNRSSNIRKVFIGTALQMFQQFTVSHPHIAGSEIHVARSVYDLSLANVLTLARASTSSSSKHVRP